MMIKKQQYEQENLKSQVDTLKNAIKANQQVIFYHRNLNLYAICILAYVYVKLYETAICYTILFFMQGKQTETQNYLQKIENYRNEITQIKEEKDKVG